MLLAVRSHCPIDLYPAANAVEIGILYTDLCTPVEMQGFCEPTYHFQRRRPQDTFEPIQSGDEEGLGVRIEVRKIVISFPDLDRTAILAGDKRGDLCWREVELCGPIPFYAQRHCHQGVYIGTYAGEHDGFRLDSSIKIARFKGRDVSNVPAVLSAYRSWLKPFLIPLK